MSETLPAAQPVGGRIGQLPPVVVWGVVEVEPDAEEVVKLDVVLDLELCADVGAADVELVVVPCDSAHAIAPPRESIAATLPAATARRARHALGFLRPVAIVLSFVPRAGSQS